MNDTITYRFVRCIGRGGFGEVYLAKRRTPDGLERAVAVKVLRSDLPDLALAIARLTDEARLLTILDHPAIVAAFELVRIRNRIALVTEYIEGLDLSRFCGPHLLPPRVVISAMGEVAAALRCAHETPSPETGRPLALVHRDIKPENIRIGRHGEIKLLDFGIARSAEVERRARTSSGNLPFTPGYTAPEAFVALRQEPATDVFALGATIYRLLCGQRFYEGVRLTDQAALSGSPELYVRYLEDRLAALPPISPSVVPLMRGVLAYDPAERPTAAVIQTCVEALSEVMAGPTPKRWARENPFPEERSLPEAELLGLEILGEPPELSLVPPPLPPRGSNAATVLLDPPSPPLPAPPKPSNARPFPWMMLGVGLVSLLVCGGMLSVASFAMGIWMGS